MKLALGTAAALLQVWSIKASTPEDVTPFVRFHPKELVKRAGRDCGKFVMYCEKAGGACNNACYHINCVDPGTAKMVYDAGNTNDKNRRQSGCQTSDGSVCNKMPFSQKFHDPFNRNPGDTSINCDEWPMATIKQDDFKDGTVRNSLHCIKDSENSSGGAQLNTFLQGTNKQGPKKTCPGDIQDGDYWTIDFNYDNTDDNAIQHCKKPQNCGGDPYAFHMTKLNSHLSFPYDTAKDNHYALDAAKADIVQCSITVHRQGDETFTATVFNEKGENRGSKTDGLKKNEDFLTVSGLPLGIAVFRTSAFGENKSPVNFNYGAKDFVHFDVLSDFAWSADEKGSSTQLASDGSYCEVGQPDGLHDTQDIKCYFPCFPEA